MRATGETAPPARRRGVRWIVAVGLVLIGVATVLFVAANRPDAPRPPAEIWVPADALDAFKGGPATIDTFDVRTAPGGARFVGWSGTWWASEVRRRTYLDVFPSMTLAQRAWLRLGGAVHRDSVGGYSAADERRESGGTVWRRMTWLDLDGLTRFLSER